MTHFEHYVAVANHVKTTLNPNTVFMEGEVIEISAPYIVLDIYGIGKEKDSTCAKIINGNKVMCYGVNRGLTHKLVSAVIEKLSGTRASGMYLEYVEMHGAITRLEDNLFEGVVEFTTRG